MTDERQNGNGPLNFGRVFRDLRMDLEKRSHPGMVMMKTRSIARLFAPKIRLAAAATLVALAALTPGKAEAAMPFDGSWSVSIETLSGTCDRTYNLAVSIIDGRFDGANGALLGTVNPKGGVSVLMGGGDRRGTASGRLAGNSGGGRWSGNATGASCSGRWTARRN
jgi:hypothetical protein